ncbi:MAG: hypothetical protein ACE5KI_07470 [Dehalococcoidia bacterium]
MIRDIRSTDLIKLSFSGLRKLPNQAKPRNRIGKDTLSLLDLVPMRYWLSMNGRRQTWVQTQGLKVKGLVSARSRSGPSVWEIDYLVFPPEHLVEEMDILHGLTLGAGRCGVDRVFLRLAAGSPLQDSIKNAGFCFYRKEYLYRLDKAPVNGALNSHTPDPPLYPRSPANEYGVFQLYNSAFPLHVREAEGQTLDEWREAQEQSWGRRGRKEYVAMEDSSVVGWVRVAGRRKNGLLDIMARPETPHESILNAGLALLKRYSTVWCLASEFQTPLLGLLEDRGFRLVEEYDTAVRYVTAKVRRPSLVPIGVK